MHDRPRPLSAAAVLARLPDWLRRDDVRRRVAATPWLRSAPPRHIKDLVAAAEMVPRAIALTFDDGPDPAITPRLLRVLASRGARATFFMCGLAARRHPDIVRAVASEGHSIGAHGWDHRPVSSLPPAEWERQIVQPLDVLGELVGRRVRWFRPPWGAVEGSTVEALRRRGIATVLWSAEGLDWHLRDAADIADHAQQHLTRGGIVLLHDAVGDLLREDIPASTAALSPDAHTDRTATVTATDLLLRRLQGHTAAIGLDELPGAPIPQRTGLRLRGWLSRTV